MGSDCIFCKIISKESPAYIIWENESVAAVLDIFPKIRGQVVLLWKQHSNSDVFLMNDVDLQNFYLAAKTVAEKMKVALGVSRVVQMMEGLEVEHAHLKLFPVYSHQDYVKHIHGSANRMLDAELVEIFNLFERG